MLRGFDAGAIAAHNFDGSRESILGDSFCLAQLSHRGSSFVSCSDTPSPPVEITVRRLGLVKDSIPAYFVAVARRLRHSKEKLLSVDLELYNVASVINLQR